MEPKHFEVTLQVVVHAHEAQQALDRAAQYADALRAGPYTFLARVTVDKRMWARKTVENFPCCVACGERGA